MFIQVNEPAVSNEKKFDILNYLTNQGKKILFQSKDGQIREVLEFDEDYIHAGYGNFRLKNVNIVDYGTLYEIVDIRDGMLVLGDYLGD